MKNDDVKFPGEHPEPNEPGDGYVAPAIVWEDEYVALAQISPPPCIPGQDPRCTP